MARLLERKAGLVFRFFYWLIQYLAQINVYIYESVNLDEAGVVGDHSRFLIYLYSLDVSI